MPFIVIYAIILHLIWAILLIVDNSPSGVTAIATLLTMVSRSLAVGILFFVALLATISYRIRTPFAFLLLLPQQYVLFVSAGGALHAMWIAQFADGVVRPRGFLVADQSPAIIAAILHMIAAVRKMRRDDKRRLLREPINGKPDRWIDDG